MKKIVKTTGMVLLAAMVSGLIPTAAFAGTLTAAPSVKGLLSSETEITLAEEVAGDIHADDLLGSAKVSLQDNVIYLPDVTAEMSDASFWIDKVEDPDEVLADRAEIDAINDAILNASGTNMHDLKNWNQETYNGITQNERNVSSGTADASYFWNSGVKYDENGAPYSSYAAAMEGLFGPLIANCIDPDAEEEMPVQYAVCTNRSNLLAYPSDNPLYDDPSDPDFGYLWLSLLRVNEPLVLKTRSADGKYYLAIAAHSSGWVSVEDIAICADKEEWLSAWDIAPENTLVVYDDKIRTEESNFAPETSNKLLPMGTCLEMADATDALIINRRAYNSHVVYLPVRKADGTYKKELALIGENRKVSEGFLPLTSANLISVALNQLGDTYGWGGMLGTDDCSGFVRNVYKCFGFELARNTTWQAAQPVYKVQDFSSMSLEEKAEAVKDLPPGSELIFGGHTMLYLGEDNDKLYVISSVSDVVLGKDESSRRVRGGMINTLDIRRGKSYNYITWLGALHTAEIPYYPADYVREFVYKTESGDGQEWTKGSEDPLTFEFRRTVNNKSALRHLKEVQMDGKAVKGEDYTAEAGGAVLTFAAAYLESLKTGSHTVQAVFDDGNAPSAEFRVLEAPEPETPEEPAEPEAPGILSSRNVLLQEDTFTYNEKEQIPAVTVLCNDRVLKEGTDYETAYADNINAGTASVTITGKGDYSGTVKKTFTILPQEKTPEVTLAKTKYVYNGKAKKPAVTVKLGDLTLESSQYKVVYAKGRKNPGTYKVKVSLTGNYSGFKTVSFKIRPKGTVLKKVKAGSRSVTVKWKKQPKQVTGYQIQLSGNRNFKSGCKSVNVRNAKTVSEKISGLKAGKTYYVRVRTYKKVNGTVYHSGWSKVKKVKIKK